MRIAIWAFGRKVYFNNMLVTQNKKTLYCHWFLDPKSNITVNLKGKPHNKSTTSLGATLLVLFVLMFLLLGCPRTQDFLIISN